MQYDCKPGMYVHTYIVCENSYANETKNILSYFTLLFLCYVKMNIMYSNGEILHKTVKNCLK